MAAIDHSTRHGRLVAVFIGGLAIFGLVAFGVMYLSSQRRQQFEATNNGDSQVVLDEADENDAEPVNSANTDEQPAPEDEPSDVVATGLQQSEADDEATPLPVTGPTEGGPTEIPATGPEIIWLIAVVGVVVTVYLSVEYRRSRVAFQRAALKR